MTFAGATATDASRNSRFIDCRRAFRKKTLAQKNPCGYAGGKLIYIKGRSMLKAGLAFLLTLFTFCFDPRTVCH